jgi:hypothetical protein
MLPGRWAPRRHCLLAWNQTKWIRPASLQDCFGTVAFYMPQGRQFHSVFFSCLSSPYSTLLLVFTFLSFLFLQIIQDSQVLECRVTETPVFRTRCRYRNVNYIFLNGLLEKINIPSSVSLKIKCIFIWYERLREKNTNIVPLVSLYSLIDFFFVNVFTDKAPRPVPIQN